MKIVRLTIDRFRNIKHAQLYFSGHTLLVGRNNVGKSTICEALDLLLGPERLRGSSPIDEWDFYNGEYLDNDDEPLQITIEAVLIDLSQEAANRFSRNLEFWHKAERRILERGEIEETDNANVQQCLRLRFVGQYNADEDEFEARTFYAHSPDEEGDDLTEVYRPAKRAIGFLYLRALRTGNRALSLERGTLLDLLLRIGEIRPRLWEDTRSRLLELDPPLDDSIGTLRSVLENIEARIEQYIPLDGSGKSTHLYVSQLTRDHLRKTLAFFMSTSVDQQPVPFQRLGTGTLNTLVFALLSAIAELKKENIIFAMEEPEIAVPPHTQRRIVSYLTGSTTQAFITSHSPYVIEKFEPEQIRILRRDDSGKVESQELSVSSGLKPKLFRRKLRHSISEAILGQAVIVGEGLVEYQVLRSAAAVMENSDAGYYPFDLSGVSFFNSDGEGNLSAYGSFFLSLGLQVFAFYDNRDRGDGESRAIETAFTMHKQTDFTGIEAMLIAEVGIEKQWSFLNDLSTEGGLPSGVVVPASQPADDEVRRLLFEVLKSRKGDNHAARLVGSCDVAALPTTVRVFLSDVFARFPKPSEVARLDVTIDSDRNDSTVGEGSSGEGSDEE
ncbi:MAG: AAA family ATPase [candidate division Zixibacteria bacterium]|jgi:putative ATP-dependent endonuclease of OLD family|nr:AAA family ATPase [candidate division Zixibacteria bacterium]